MHILKKKTESKVTTETSERGGEYRVRLFINGHPQCEADFFTDDQEEAARKARQMREKCIANGARDETRSTRDAIKAVQESVERLDLRNEEIAIEVSNKIYKPILHRFGKWMYEAEEFRVYSDQTRLTKELKEELWGIRYDLELFDASGLYDPPPEEDDPWHESPSVLWDIMEEKTEPADFHGYEHYKSRREAENNRTGKTGGIRPCW